MDGVEWPAEVNTYNEKFTKMIEAVKRRHDPVVTTVGKFCTLKNTWTRLEAKACRKYSKEKMAPFMSIGSHFFFVPDRVEKTIWVPTF